MDSRACQRGVRRCQLDDASKLPHKCDVHAVDLCSKNGLTQHGQVGNFVVSTSYPHMSEKEGLLENVRAALDFSSHLVLEKPAIPKSSRKWRHRVRSASSLANLLSLALSHIHNGQKNMRGPLATFHDGTNWPSGCE